MFIKKAKVDLIKQYTSYFDQKNNKNKRTKKSIQKGKKTTISRNKI